jgi:nucleotide-binding universal stress UspA family protein
MYRHILIPIDGSRLSEGAVEAGVRIAKAFGARVTVIHVVPQPSASLLDAWSHHDREFEAHLEKVLEGRGREYLDAACEAAHRAGLSCDCALVHGESPHEEIVMEARSRGCDLVVMASHGRKDGRGLLLASETIKVMTLGDLPVLVHRAPRPVGAGGDQASAG